MLKLYPTWVYSRHDKTVRFQTLAHPHLLMEKTIYEVKPGSFIFIKDNALPLDVCAEMIARFEKHSDEQYPGHIGQTMDFDNSIKRSPIWC